MILCRQRRIIREPSRSVRSEVGTPTEVLQTNNGTITITEYTSPAGAVSIPSEINGLPVTSIGDQALSGCHSLTNITIGNSFTSIGNYASMPASI
jgi:hypothetical protein